MLFTAMRRDITETKKQLSLVTKKIDDMHKVIYVHGNGISGRMIRAEEKADSALKAALSRTTAIWMIFVFAMATIAGVFGYQMYKIDCLSNEMIIYFKGLPSIFLG